MRGHHGGRSWLSLRAVDSLGGLGPTCTGESTKGGFIFRDQGDVFLLVALNSVSLNSVSLDKFNEAVDKVPVSVFESEKVLFQWTTCKSANGGA